MPIFPILEMESKIQVNDKTRLNGTKSFKNLSTEEIKKVEIQPDADSDFYEVTNEGDSSLWFLDWVYATPAEDEEIKTVTLKITDLDDAEHTATKDIEVVIAADENLFSNDAELVQLQSDIMKYVSEGRSSHLEKHRAAQETIMEEIYKSGITSTNDEKLVPADVIDVAELKQWSKYLVLYMIYSDVSNAIDDIFDRKAKDYRSKAADWRDLSMNNLRIDYDKDGTQESGEQANFRTGRLYR